MAKYAEIEPDIECWDVWNPGTLAPEAMAAYKLLEEQGQIRVLRVYVRRATERVTVRYLSTVSHEWMLGALGEARRELG